MISAYSPAVCSLEAARIIFYQRLHDLTRTKSNIVTLAKDLDAKIDDIALS